MIFSRTKPSSKNQIRAVVKSRHLIGMSVLALFLLTAFSGRPQTTPEPTVVSGAGDITAVVEEYRQLLAGRTTAANLALRPAATVKSTGIPYLTK